MSVKTFVITLPKPLPPGAQVKGVVTPQMLSKVTTAGKPTTMDFSGNLVHFIKEEPTQVIEVSESEKPVRKRQKLDHLTYEEKIMRRKLKNRVAAQTARDRKKVRMEELELQVSEMAKEMTEITNLMEMLTEQNQQLEQKNTLLGERLSQCTCNTISTSKSASKRSANVVSERKTPVCGVTEQSAELPRPRAVTLQAAIWVLFLTIMCSQSEMPLTGALSVSQEAEERVLESLKALPQDLSGCQLKETVQKWMLHHQPPWTPPPTEVASTTMIIQIYP